MLDDKTYIENADRLIRARTEQLRSAVTITDILTQALNDIKAKVDDASRARIEKALSEAEAIRKAEIARVEVNNQ